MRLAIVGVREYTNLELIHRMITALRDGDEVVSRGATPTDRIIIRECSVRGVVCHIVKADYESFSTNGKCCKSTDKRRRDRDKKILDMVGSVLYFTDGGAEDQLLHYAEERHIPWVAFDQDGRKLPVNGKCVQNPDRGEVYGRNETAAATHVVR